MNFFQSQANARSQTKRLIFLFVLAVLSLVVLANLLVMGINGYLNLEGQALTLSYMTDRFDWLTFLIISAIVVAFILVGSIYKTASLSGGGKVVAESLGGTSISHSTDNLQYKILLNVVEEMAIASGTPVPQVYVLQKEPAINAFAAGFSTDDAVIGITQGALDCFNREELQGVIAHEFSHVANGDMRLNMRLTGVLHGILLIGLLGYFIMRASAVGRRSKEGNKLVFLGLGLIVIGYGGTLFGNAIKASVSRQREYLADASAVQYTRDNQGIANALKKIGGYEAGSKLDTPEAQSMSHAFFSNALSNKFTSFLSTHPPLAKRIKALQPNWTGEFSKTRVLNDAEIKANAAGFSQFAGGESGSTQTIDSVESMPENASQGGKNQAALLAGIGQLSDTRIALAKNYLQAIPKELLETVRSPSGAQAYVYALLLSDKSANDKSTVEKGKLREEQVLSRQWEYLLAYLPSEIYSNTSAIFDQVHTLDIRYRLPLLEIALPNLRQIPSQRYEAMLTQMKYLVFVDNALSIFEWSITNIVANYLKTEFEIADTKQVKYSTAQEVRQHIEVMLSALLNEFCKRQEHQSILKQAEDILRLTNLRLLDEKSVSIEDFAGAVSKLRLLNYDVKEKLLQLCMFAVTQDKDYTPQEHEALRAVSECLGCPMPPDLGGTK
jgi:Zn-dependent protease with chaperone function